MKIREKRVRTESTSSVSESYTRTLPFISVIGHVTKIKIFVAICVNKIDMYFIPILYNAKIYVSNVFINVKDFVEIMSIFPLIRPLNYYIILTIFLLSLRLYKLIYIIHLTLWTPQLRAKNSLWLEEEKTFWKSSNLLTMRTTIFWYVQKQFSRNCNFDYIEIICRKKSRVKRGKQLLRIIRDEIKI